MKSGLHNLELTTAQDRFFDFCLWEYEPRVSFAEKLRSVNLLFHSFELSGVDSGLFELVHTIREGLGPSKTVWGAKKLGDLMSWEFYFYDYRRRERSRSVTRLMDIIRPQVACNVEINENLHYFMFSIDIDNDLVMGEKDLDEIHLYIGNPGSTVSSGICYSMKRNQTRLENFYFFFDAQKQWQEILFKFACSVHYDATRVRADHIIWPELKDCKIIVIANKQANDAIYFSGINVDQLIFFLNRMDYDGDLVAFVETHRSMLDHLQFDIGFDYRIEGDDMRILKSAYYGVF